MKPGKRLFGLSAAALMLMNPSAALLAAEEPGGEEFTILTDHPADYELDGTSVRIKDGAHVTVSGSGRCLIIEEGAHAEITLNHYVCERPDEWSGPAILLREGAQAVLHLSEGSVNKLKGGPEDAAIRVLRGSSLAIDGTGVLEAVARSSSKSSAGTGAAIGGNIGQVCGDITINGGTVRAAAEYHRAGTGAAIGGGAGSGPGNGRITINGGSVTAAAAGNGAAIGGGGASSYPTVANGPGDGGMITITGGTVTVSGNIGGGEGAASQGTLSVRGGARITANRFTGADIAIAGDSARVTIQIEEDLTIPEGTVQTVLKGMTLDIAPDVTITCNGAIVNNGAITGSGTINNRDAQGDLSGSGTVSGAAVIPRCRHAYEEDWSQANAQWHKKECVNGCGKRLFERHQFAGDRCTICGAEAMPPYHYDEPAKTLTVYSDLEEDWDRGASDLRDAETLILEDGVTAVPPYAFASMHDLKYIYIPSTLPAEGVGRSAFRPFGIDPVIYAPAHLRNTLEEQSPYAVQVFYTMKADRADIAAISGRSIPADMPIPADLYGKPVYFSNNSLTNCPDLAHTHRASSRVTGADAHKHYTGCAVCGKPSLFEEPHTGGTDSYFKKKLCTVCGEAYGDLPVDTTPPTGSLRLGDTLWDGSAPVPAVPLFFKDALYITADALDDSEACVGYTEDKAAAIAYYVHRGDTPLPEDALLDKPFTPYTGSIALSEEGRYTVYATITDHAGNRCLIGTNELVLDQTAPVFTGLQDGGVYAPSAAGRVWDANGVSLAINGHPAVIENGMFTLAGLKGTVNITASDPAGNQTTLTVTVKEDGGETPSAPPSVPPSSPSTSPSLSPPASPPANPSTGSRAAGGMVSFLLCAAAVTVRAARRRKR